MITTRDIEVNPGQIQVVADMPLQFQEPYTKLHGMKVALTRFISKTSNHARPLLQHLKKGSTCKWMPKCQQSFDRLKLYLQTPPVCITPITCNILGFYPRISDIAISSIGFKELDKVKNFIYYVSKTLQPAETRYPPIEQLAFILVTIANKCECYFQPHRRRVDTIQPLKHTFDAEYKFT